MCGIAGAIGRNKDELTRRMAGALAHRGPDDEAYYHDDGVTLGFRRLSIVDIDGGRQPIANETGELILVCNGEIYNSPALRENLRRRGHRFRTNSDVEVILHLYEEYGAGCLSHLEGMFAFALWDVRSRRIFLARDHMGQKPLYYYHDGDNFYFASEIQALVASGAVERQLDIDALWHYMSLRFMPDHYSLIRGIRKIPAATYLFFNNGQVETDRYWHLDFRNKLKLSDTEAVDALDERLRDTARSHLLSDVRVGSFISSGIDSTTIASMAARETAESMPVFCVGVEEAGFDEMPMAQKVAEANGMSFFGERVHADIASLLPVMVQHLGEPADPYGVGIYLVSKLAAQHVKVVLSGDGGDESFGGYDRYLGQRLVEIYCWLPEKLRRTIMPKLIAMVPETFQYKSLAQRLAWLQEMSKFSDGQRYARALGFLRFTPEAKDQLFTEQARQQLSDADSISRVLRFFDSEQVNELTDRMLYTDLMTRVADHNLVMSDRMSMASSLEVRSPFVDPRLVEFAASLPVNLKIRGRQLKYLLRKVAARYLPQEVVRLPKQGFGFPIGQWMRKDLRNAIENRLTHSKFVEEGIFRPEYLRQLVGEHVGGQLDHSYRLWLLLSLEIWYELYLEGKSPEAVKLEY
jgi:asparagine synthase (glutamine-hydrolysing)